jgi:cytosine deaminase
VLIDAPSASDAIRSIAPVVAGWKKGRKTFSRPRAELYRPQATSDIPEDLQ